MNDIKAQADAMGIPMSWVESRYRELRAIEEAIRARDVELRSRVWNTYCQPGQVGFWRCGFSRLNAAFKHAFGEGDRTTIPGFDCLADELAYSEFPELSIDNDPAETLYEYLARPHVRRMSKAELMQQALDSVAAMEFTPVTDEDASWRTEEF